MSWEYASVTFHHADRTCTNQFRGQPFFFIENVDDKNSKIKLKIMSITQKYVHCSRLFKEIVLDKKLFHVILRLDLVS